MLKDAVKQNGDGISTKPIDTRRRRKVWFSIPPNDRDEIREAAGMSMDADHWCVERSCLMCKRRISEDLKDADRFQQPDRLPELFREFVTYRQLLCLISTSS